MSNYFTRLVAHTLGVSEGVQPLIPPRFAPVDKQTLTANEPTLSEPSAVPESGPPIAPRLRGDSPLLDLPDISCNRPTPEVSECVSRVETMPGFAEAAPGTSLLFPVVPRRPLDESIPARRTHAVSVDLSPMPIPTVLTTPETAESAPPVPGAIHPLVESADRTETPTADRGNESALQDRREPPAPIIRVTIGRIEVRAVAPTPPAPPAPRPKLPGPRLTLESYLRSRSEGGS